MSGGEEMLGNAVLFLIIAIIAGAVGFSGIAGAASTIAQILFVLFLILFLVSFFTFALASVQTQTKRPRSAGPFAVSIDCQRDAND